MNSLYYEFNSSVNLNCFKIDAYWVVFFFKFKKEWGGETNLFEGYGLSRRQWVVPELGMDIFADLIRPPGNFRLRHHKLSTTRHCSNARL